jgi:hypothetical protein
MRDDILNAIDNPKELELLYRSNKTIFKKEFNLVYPEIKHFPIADFWHERLNYESSDISWGTKYELLFIILASLLAGVIAKIPILFPIDADFFYTRNIGFIIFPILISYFVWKNNFKIRHVLFFSGIIICSLIFINLLPINSKSSTLILSCIHLPGFLWSILCIAFMGNGNYNRYDSRIEFLRFNGDLIVMTTLILIAGMILTGIFIVLFSIIGSNIDNLYFEYIVILGLAASPIVGTYIVQTNPQIVNKVSPVIAKIFSPLVLITLAVFLITMINSGKDPYNDREFLLVFNSLLIGVMVIILFSIVETFNKDYNRISLFILFTLAVLTIVVNSIALSAILFRISEWGISPNRLSVLGGNILMLINLLLISYRLFRVVIKRGEIEDVKNVISRFLPVYTIWTFIITFIFPFIFSFN